MKTRIMLAALLALCALCFSGCLGAGLDEEFVRAVDKNWKTFGPDLRQYIEKDAELPQASKDRRLRAVDEFTKLVGDAVADIDEE